MRPEVTRRHVFVADLDEDLDLAIGHCQVRSRGRTR